MVDEQQRASHARKIMDAFAQRTGLTSAREPRRYLWTDAFAVSTYLSLHRAAPEGPYLELALSLVDQVHHVLGRYRDDDERTGWLSGLPEEEGELHPTLGGLRIGKPLPERPVTEPFSSDLEWERDGQYFHYLTKWILALHLVAEETGDAAYEQWAVELAKTAYERFSYGDGPGIRRMAWKMSTDLSRPLVPTMGQHDPLDGLVVVATLKASSLARADEALDRDLEELVAMCRGQSFATPDPLGIGGLLQDGYLLQRVLERGEQKLSGLERRVLDDAERSLAFLDVERLLEDPADRRLAFRELGLSLGLAAAERLLEEEGERVAPYLPLRDRIESFWLEPEHQGARTWQEHLDINEVMLAASLAPEGLLGD